LRNAPDPNNVPPPNTLRHATRKSISRDSPEALAVQLKTDGSSGIAYDSVRDPKGECIAIFCPKVLFNCRQERHLTYFWDGAAISTIYERRDLTL
jgi:hypothetical protein